jgi:hypothetical protein
MYVLNQPQSDFFLLNAKFPLFVGGFGSGKTHTLIACALADLTKYPGMDIAIYEPTFDLMRLILIPRLEEALTEAGLKYQLVKQEFIYYVQGLGRIILRSLDRPERIIGYEVFRSHVDELDSLKIEKANDVWNKIIARQRQKNSSGAENRCSVYSTPEGFNFTYQRWGKSPSESYQFKRISTYSNEHLPDGYIESLLESYPPNLVAAYLDGIWTNLTSGSVYPDFDKTLNHSDTEPSKYESLYVGMDFNVYRGAAVVHIIRDGIPIAVGEVKKSKDTEDTIRILKEHYPDNTITVFPDASGKHRESANVTETDLFLLRRAGFIVKAKSGNPLIKERVAAVNAMICNAEGLRRWKVNTHKCPFLVEALEQQIYDSNGMPEKDGELDDIADALGYFIHHMFPIVRKRLQVVAAYGR